MSSALGTASGLLLVFCALGALFASTYELRGHDYLAAILLAVVGIALLRSGVDLLRPSVGE